MNETNTSNTFPYSLEASDLIQHDQYHIKPLWSLVGVLAGWIAGVSLIPEQNHFWPGALSVSGTVFSLGLLFGAALSCARSPVSLFRVEHLLMFGLVYWILLDAAQGGYGLWGVSRDAVVISYNSIGLFAAAIWGGSLLTSMYPMRTSATEQEDVSTRFLFWGVIVSFCLGMLRVLISCKMSPACLYENFFVSRLFSSWFMQDLGNWDTILHNLRYFGYLTLPLTVAMVHLERKLTLRGLVAGILSLLFLIILIRDGGRRNVGTVLGASALVWVLLQHKIGLKQMFLIALLGAGVLFVMQAMIAWRDIGFGTALVEGHDIVYEKRRGISVDVNLLTMGQIADIVPKLHPHTGTTGLKFVIMKPFPKSVLPNKPVDRGFNLMKYTQNRYIPGYSWTCSVVGDFYLMRGFWAVLAGGLFFGFLTNLASRQLYYSNSVRSKILYALIAMTLFVALRALHELIITGFTVMAFLLLLYLRRLRLGAT